MEHTSHKGIDVFVPKLDNETNHDVKMRSWFIAKNHLAKNVIEWSNVWLCHVKLGTSYIHTIQRELRKYDLIMKVCE